MKRITISNSEFELKNVSDGEHTLRVFPSRPWHESYKDEGAFQTVKFIVKDGGADATKPTTRQFKHDDGKRIQGKEMKESKGGRG